MNRVAQQLDNRTSQHCLIELTARLTQRVLSGQSPVVTDEYVNVRRSMTCLIRCMVEPFDSSDIV